MTAFSELLKANFPDGWSNREVARKAEELGVKLSRATVDKYTGDVHGRPNEPTLQAFHVVLGIPIHKLRQAAKVQIGEADPWLPPPEANRLTQRQRSAINELIRAIVSVSDVGRPPVDELYEAELKLMAEAARVGVDDILFDSARWARESNYDRARFIDVFIQLLRTGEVTSTPAVIDALKAGGFEGATRGAAFPESSRNPGVIKKQDAGSNLRDTGPTRDLTGFAAEQVAASRDDDIPDFSERGIFDGGHPGAK